MAVGLYWSEYEHHMKIERAHARTSGADNIYTGSLISTGILFIQTIGGALIAIGIVNIAIETDDWRRYFAERLQGVCGSSSGPGVSPEAPWKRTTGRSASEALQEV